MEKSSLFVVDQGSLSQTESKHSSRKMKFTSGVCLMVHQAGNSVVK